MQGNYMKNKLTIFQITLLSILLLGASIQTGQLILSNASRVEPPAWDDLRVPVNAVKINAADKPPDFGSFLGAGNLYTYLLSYPKFDIISNGSINSCEGIFFVN